MDIATYKAMAGTAMSIGIPMVNLQGLANINHQILLHDTLTAVQILGALGGLVMLCFAIRYKAMQIKVARRELRKKDTNSKTQ